MLAGCLFGLLCLTRPSFAVLAPVVAGLLAVNGFWLSRAPWRTVGGHVLVFAIAWLAIVGPWLARNAVSVGTWGLTEEYGSAALIERFAYDDMTAREFALAFPYCLPAIGEPVIDRAFGPEAMERFVYYTPKSFFHVGRAHRDKLVEAHGRLDPLIKDVDPRRDARARLALSRGERSAGVVRPMGRRAAWGSRWCRCSLRLRAWRCAGRSRCSCSTRRRPW